MKARGTLKKNEIKRVACSSNLSMVLRMSPKIIIKVVVSRYSGRSCPALWPKELYRGWFLVFGRCPTIVLLVLGVFRQGRVYTDLMYD